MATISFHAGENFTIQNLGGSGLGFYGAGGFGTSVGVGEYNDTVFITNSNGTVQGPQVDCIKYLNSASGTINSSVSGQLLTKIPNYFAQLNVRFEHTSAVTTQNVKFRVYDRTSINNNPSGVTCKVAELIHPDTVQNNNGSGDSTWTTVYGSGSVLDLVASPGLSGERPNGASTSSTRHDWFLAITASPDSVGSKLFAGYVELEYL